MLFKISGTGCALVDHLYNPVYFNDTKFNQFLSRKPGDGGLSPGKLVFKEEFEKFCKKDYLQVRNKITNGKQPVAMNVGGPSIVSLIHAAQMLHGSEAEVNFYGCRGSDDAGNFIENKLANTPLRIGKYITRDQDTPYTDVLCDPEFDEGSGERIFINNIGAARNFMPSDIDDSFFESDMVVFGGTALVPHIHSALDGLLKKAKEHKAITLVNTVYDFLSEKQNPLKPWPLGSSDETYNFIDLLITDMEESIRLSGTNTVEAAVNFFKSKGVGALIITHGSSLLHFFADNSLFGKISPATLPVSEKVISEIRQDPDKTVDTVGCGDNFAGGVIASIADQLMENPAHHVNLIKAVGYGVVSGGFTCFYNGGTYYEDFSGEKAQLVGKYYKEYLTQIGLEEDSIT